MDNTAAKPYLLKQMNLMQIRRIIMKKGTATRAEISSETSISSTTVRSLLCEMQQNAEIENIGYDLSSGGRKAERYRFNPNRYYCAAICLANGNTYGLTVNICGEIIETTPLRIYKENYLGAITNFLDNLILKRDIKSIGVAVPGIPCSNGFLRKNDNGEIIKIDILDTVMSRYGIPVVMENDIKATAVGVELEYERKRQKKSKHANMAYLYFEENCVNAGLITDGNIVRGCNNFAGELGLIRLEDGKTVDEKLATATNDREYAQIVTTIINWLCGILNPQHIALFGENLRHQCLPLIENALKTSVPKHMQPKLHISTDATRNCHIGIASLAASKMFDEIQHIKG